jgi:hypothetical protein
VLNAGAQTLTATCTPNDTADYYAASASVTLTVNPAVPTILTLPTASAITVGQALSASTLTGGTMSSVPGTFAWTTPSTVPAVGTDSESVTFTPTDATDYTMATADVQIVVNPTVPQIVSLTPRYAVGDDFKTNVPSTIICVGCNQGDLLHDVTGIFSDLTWPSSSETQGYSSLWEQGNYEPTWDTVEIQHPNGPYGNQASIAFVGSGSQSTFVCSPTTGTCFEDEQQNGQVHWQKTDGTTGVWFANANSVSPTEIAADDTTGNMVYLGTGTSTHGPWIGVADQTGSAICSLTPTDMSFISSIAAKGGYMAFTDPVENLVGIAKMDCTEYKTVSVAGQPWSVAMTNGAELDAHVLSRDKCANGIPCVTKITVPSGTVEGSVDLAGVTPVSTIRATAPYEGLYQVQAFSLSPAAAVLFMSDSTDGTVLTISTNTSNGAKMKISYTTPIADLPIAIATQETASSSTLWVAYIAADSMDAITHIGAIDPTTGDYTRDIGACQTGILAGGFVATSNGVYCAQGSAIAPPLALQP